MSKIFTFTPDYPYEFDCEVIKGGTGYDVKHLYPFSVGIQFHRFNRVDITFLIPYQAERALANATSAEELKTKLAVRVDAVIHRSA